MDITDLAAFAQKFTEPSINGAFLIPSNYIKHFTNSAQNPLSVLPETVMSGHSGLVFPQHHLLFRVFNKKLIQLKSGGIIQDLVKIAKPQDAEPYDGSSVLTVDHLTIGFHIWLIVALIALIAFCIEFPVYWINICLNR